MTRTRTNFFVSSIAGWLFAFPLCVMTTADSPRLIASDQERLVVANASLLSERDYSFGYWLNGFRKSSTDTTPNLLCLETGYYGFTIDVEDFRQVRTGWIAESTDYVGALTSGVDRIRSIEPARLMIEVAKGNRVFRATGCQLDDQRNPKRLQSIRMWESGKLVQHYDLQDLVFKDADGNRLGCDGVLDVVAWPQSLTLTASLTPRNGLVFQKTFDEPGAEPVRDSEWNDVVTRISLQTKKDHWETEKKQSGMWAEGQTRHLSLVCEMGDEPTPQQKIKVRVNDSMGQTFPVKFQPNKQCFVADVEKLKRKWKKGYTDIRQYDEFEIEVENQGDSDVRVPFLLDFRDPANITGLCPLLCNQNGVPTGIPVQISKNWHLKEIGNYLRACALLPVPPGRTKYRLRIPYGFYGTLPSASVAQLCLIGWGGHGRWDQMAIGCWGETMCLDMDMSCVDVAITDVRSLMTRNGRNGKHWDWTNAGWGGDWLSVLDEGKQKIAFGGLKTAYLAHGPCLTEVRYDGHYGSGRNAAVKAIVRTIRTDDYARTFHTLKYRFRKEGKVDGSWLFKMGRTNHLVTPKIAYGNRDGLIQQQVVPKNLKPNELLVDKITLSGEGPWWVAFPGAKPVDGKDWGTASRALIVRSYRASFGSETFFKPTISMPLHQVQKDGQSDLDLLLVPPPGVKRYEAGDSVAMELEWITVPRVAEDYYGPNEALRKHLAEHPRSWKTVHREAIGNNLDVRVTGGKLLSKYPIIIRATAVPVRVMTRGGVGAVPIRFEGLSKPDGYTLCREFAGKKTKFDQSVHGNDFWQTDYDPATNTYQITYNLPLDGLPVSTWVLSDERIPKPTR